MGERLSPLPLTDRQQRHPSLSPNPDMRRAAALLAALGVAAAQTGEDLSCLDVCGDTCQWDCGCLDADCR